MQYNFKKKILGFFSLGTMLFAFQACYGTPQDFGSSTQCTCTVLSEDRNAIEGIKVSVVGSPQYDYTDDEGKLEFYTEWTNEITVRFEDIDGETNGSYQTKDTSVYGRPHVYLEIILSNK